MNLDDLRKLAEREKTRYRWVTLSPEGVIELLDRVEKAEQALQRVRELHRRQPDTISGLDTGPAYCRCGEHYPCPTVRALEGDE